MWTSVDWVHNKNLPFFDRNNVNLLNSNAAVYDRVEETGCSVHEKFAFILHGWRQDCDKTDWVKQLRESKYMFHFKYRIEFIRL